MSDPTCSTCHWWRPVDQKRVTGACHRFPPKTVVGPDEDDPSEWDVKGSVWPVTPAHELCGEYRGAN